jgi:hypothetical protein
MKRVLGHIVVISTIIVPYFFSQVAGASANGVVLCEFSPQSNTSASEEYVVLCNNTGGDIDVTGWRLEYSAGTSGTSWTKKADLSGTITAGGEHVLATAGYMMERLPTLTFSSGLALSSGHLRITRPDQSGNIEEDRVGWGSALAPETAATEAPSAGQFLLRKLSEDSTFQDTDNNALDFHEPEYIAGQEPPEAEPEPEPDAVPEPEPEPTPETSAEPTVEETDSAAKVVPIELSELLVDPVSPATDANDEFVELYNPSDEPADLDGYQLQAGANYSYKQSLDELSIPAHGYLTLYSLDSNLTLSNAGSKVRLLAPTKTVISEITYEKAVAGAAYARFSSGWQWTTTPTPDQPNVFTQASAQEAAKTAAAAKKKKTAAAAKSSTKSTARAKAAAAQAATGEAYEEPAADEVNTPLHPAVLAGVGGSAVLYGLYEYRQDLGNRVWQFRRYAKRWRASR